MDPTEIDPGLLAVADQVYAGLLDEWPVLDDLWEHPSAFTAEFEMRLRAALEPQGRTYPDEP
jgi:hypothetical protein